MKTIRTGIIGMGRIGKIHLENICTRIPGAEVVAVMNPSERGREFAKNFNVKLVTDNADHVISHPEVDAVLICSSTNAHADYVEKAARAGKAIFCEKPMDLSISRVKNTLALVRETGVPLMLAFNQRFDSNFADVKKHIAQGKLGNIFSVKITSRDPGPPPVEYIKASGGLFMDMTIHDFDMARFIVNDEVTEVYAKGYNLIDPAIGEAGDIDTGFVLLTFANSATAVIENSRKANYGYDQRLEVFGSNGMVRTENPFKTTNLYFNDEGGHTARHLDFFMDRYRESYLAEIEAFLSALRSKTPMPVTGEDGLQAMLIAEAANMSVRGNRPVPMEEVKKKHGL